VCNKNQPNKKKIEGKNIIRFKKFVKKKTKQRQQQQFYLKKTIEYHISKMVSLSPLFPCLCAQKKIKGYNFRLSFTGSLFFCV